MIYIGLDNGATGSIGMINTKNGDVFYSGVPTREVQDYVQERRTINRLNVDMLEHIILDFIPNGRLEREYAVLERPMINPARFQASIHAARCFEAALLVFEELEIKYRVIDSRIWQLAILPKGTKGAALKQESFNVGLDLFPQKEIRDAIIKQSDADALLIAEYARRVNY